VLVVPLAVLVLAEVSVLAVMKSSCWLIAVAADSTMI
jgi:hypothetical protein